MIAASFELRADDQYVASAAGVAAFVWISKWPCSELNDANSKIEYQLYQLTVCLVHLVRLPTSHDGEPTEAIAVIDERRADFRS